MSDASTRPIARRLSRAPLGASMRIRRAWSMPNSETFSIPPIAEFVHAWLSGSQVSVDPFARNCSWATYTNDLNPTTSAQYHQDAEEFLQSMVSQGVVADLVIFDPPYSPRQIKELYAEIGKPVTKHDTQNSALYARVRKSIRSILAPGGTVLSFGWNSCGMGKGFEIVELLLVAHGGAHNDTICMAETHLTQRAPDSLKAGVLSLPESVKVESVLPAMSG